MSASNKKKLRKEQNAAAMTEKQKKEQREAKKLKAYTLTFAIVMVLVVAIVVGVVVGPLIDGAVRRGSTAITVGDHKLSAADLNYFYMDAISEHQQAVYEDYYSSFGNYWSIMLGFDTTKALNEQTYDEETGDTWADYFMDSAIKNARIMYALYDDAKANGYTLTEDEQSNIDSYGETLEWYATYYGYSSVKSYLRANYGNGASKESYLNYYEVCTLASSYLSHYYDEVLEYDLDDYRAYETDNECFDDYSTVSYIYYSLSYKSYLGEGTKDEEGNTTWTDDEKEAARVAMKADMEAILAGSVVDKDTFDKAVQALEINKVDEEDKDATLATASEVKDAYFANISLNESAYNWLKESGRTPGELKAFEVYTYAEHEDVEHVHGDDCGCDRTVDGYTIVLFTERDDQTTKMVNVRHILVAFEGGTEDEDGNVTYSDEEKATAKNTAEMLLQQWLDGKANEDSFAELANSESDDNDGNVTNGGLYEDIVPGQMVEAFDEWCFDETREPGNYGIVETEFGYHIMYFVSTDEMSYRDQLIDADMRAEDTEKWRDDLMEKTPYTVVSLDLMELDYVISE